MQIRSGTFFPVGFSPHNIVFPPTARGSSAPLLAVKQMPLVLFFEHSELRDITLVYDRRACPALHRYRDTKMSKSVFTLQLDFMVKYEGTKDSRFILSVDKY